MFKEDIYREIRDDFEICEGKGDESFLCRFMRKEKERDIRILIREDRLKLADSQELDSMIQNLRKLLEDMLYFMAKDPRKIGACKDKEELLRLVGIDKDVRKISEKSRLKKAVEKKRVQIGTLFEEMDEDEIERQKKKLIRAGRMIIGLWDDAKREDPYIALREEYMDYLLGERTEAEVLEKARAIDRSYRKKYVAEEIDKKIKKFLRAEAELSRPGELEETVTQLSSAILKAEAKAFLYDAGFPLPPKKTGKGADLYENEETGADREKEIARKQDRVMDLVSSYCDSHGISVRGKSAIHTESSSVDFDSEEFRDAAEKLYHALRKENRTTAYVPLCIDEKNGSGIYIIGRDHIPKGSYKELGYEAKKRSCFYCCLYGFALNKDEDGEELMLTLDVEICKDIEDAILIYKGRREEYAIYTDNNGEPVEDVDEKFLPYFLIEEGLL